MLRESLHEAVYKYALVLVAITLPFHLRLNVLCLVLLFVNWLLEGGFKAKFDTFRHDRYAQLSVLFFLWYVIELLFTHNIKAGWFAVEKKAAFLVVPLIILSRKTLFGRLSDNFFRAFCYAVSAAVLVCIMIAACRYTEDGDANHFVYHTLAGNIHQSAIYLSLLSMLAAGYLQLTFRDATRREQWFHGFLLLVLSLGILLLSSKLHIVLYAIVSIGFSARYLYKRKLLFAGTLAFLLIVSSVIVFTDNPVRRRYRDIHLEKVKQFTSKHYSQSEYFDGASLRMALLSFGLDILKEQKAYVLGVSPGDSQALLNREIKDNGLYEGYLNYDFHNQYMETLVSCGIIGLLLLLCLLGYLVRVSWHAGFPLILYYCILFAVCFITEGVLEMEIGVVSFSLVFALLMSKVAYRTIFDRAVTIAPQL